MCLPAITPVSPALQKRANAELSRLADLVQTTALVRLVTPRTRRIVIDPSAMLFTSIASFRERGGFGA